MQNLLQFSTAFTTIQSKFNTITIMPNVIQLDTRFIMI